MAPIPTVCDSAGNLYGTTLLGGPVNCGVVYKLDTTGHQTVLHSFGGPADGGFPHSGVVRDSAGNLYGTATAGGAGFWGIIYKIGTAGEETVLYNFTGTGNGAQPVAGVIRDSTGNLYGTTLVGGTAGASTVFKLDTTGHESVLYTFPVAPDGTPGDGLTRDSAGNLYGTTVSGGPAGVGVVYKLDAAGRQTVLHSFTGGVDGAFPYAGVIRDVDGNLYGTTHSGGTANFGVVYKLDLAGHLTVLYSFTGGVDGGNPYASVIRDLAGNLYGTTFGGGTANAGVVYKLDLAGHLTPLYSFTGGADGGNPYASVIRDSAGSLYGTTLQGATSNAGVIYKLDKTGHQTVLYSFTGGTDGGTLRAGLIHDPEGNLYGTTANGGASGRGVVYKLDTAGHQSVLYSFADGIYGSYPRSGVVRDSMGNLYGTASSGGTAGLGVVYKLDTTGHESVLYSFTGTDGNRPQAGLISDSAGNFFGTTAAGGKSGAGVVFKLKLQ